MRARDWVRARAKEEHGEQRPHLGGILVPRGQRGYDLEAEIAETRPRLQGVYWVCTGCVWSKESGRPVGAAVCS